MNLKKRIRNASIGGILGIGAISPCWAGENLLNAHALGILWGLPFIGILLSLALLPLIAPRLWHLHYGKVACFWAFAVLIPLAHSQGMIVTFHTLAHTYLLEYIPFMILMGTLYTIAGGIKIHIDKPATPSLNMKLMMTGTFLASFIGTTGAAMLLIRPLIALNAWRSHRRHLIIFFIFLVCNLGGCLTAFGDPPLFLGFLNGIDFFWPTRQLFYPFLIVAFPVLTLFYGIDRFLYQKEKNVPLKKKRSRPVLVEGKVNFVLLIGVMVAIYISGAWHPAISFNMFGVEMKLQNLARDCLLLGLAGFSWWVTPKTIHSYNLFSWTPMGEVAKIFAAIFITAIPVIAMLDLRTQGVFAYVDELVTHNGMPSQKMYFWLTGFFSSILDNAPTYLVFFHLAGGNPTELMGPLASTLGAISCGSVFMGAMTYIGNAPNFMVKSIAEENDIPMPSFFGYLKWSGGILLPPFILLSLLWF